MRNNEKVPESKNSDVVVRKAIAADSRAILGCLAAAFEPYRTSYTHHAYLDTILTEETITARLAVMQVFVAVAGDQIVGTIACSKQHSNEGHLRGMAVSAGMAGTRDRREAIARGRGGTGATRLFASHTRYD